MLYQSYLEFYRRKNFNRLLKVIKINDMTNLEVAVDMLKINNPYNYGLLIKDTYDNLLNLLNKHKFDRSSLKQKLNDISFLKNLLIDNSYIINESSLILLLLKQNSELVNADLVEIDEAIENQCRNLENRISLLYLSNCWIYKYLEEINIVNYNFSNN